MQNQSLLLLLRLCSIAWDEVQDGEKESVTQKERGRERECVCAKVSERPRENVICLTGIPDDKHTRAVRRKDSGSTVKPDRESLCSDWSPLQFDPQQQRRAAGLNGGGPRKVTPGAVVSE